MPNLLKTIMKKKRLNYFTLLELVVTISLLVSLSLVVLPRYENVYQDSDANIKNANLWLYKKSILNYKDLYAELPQCMNLAIANAWLSNEDYTQNGFIAPSIKQTESPSSSIFNSTWASKLHVKIHILNSDEADELIRLGIREVGGLQLHNQGFSSLSHHANFTNLLSTKFGMYEVKSGLGVLMLEGNANTSSAEIPEPNINTSYAVDSNYRSLNPDFAYRIIMGIDANSGLIKKGLLSSLIVDNNIDPRGNDFRFNYYCVLLPRLRSTVERFGNWASQSFTWQNETTNETREANFLKVQDSCEIEIINPWATQSTADTGRWRLQKN